MALICQVSRAEISLRDASYRQHAVDLTSSHEVLQIKRLYQSRSTDIGLFGFGWCSDFEEAVTHVSPLALHLKSCQGITVFHHTGGRHYRSRFNDEMQMLESGYTLQTAGGAVARFDRQGRLVFQKRGTGSELFFSYDERGLLFRISDHRHEIYLEYEPRSGKVIQVKGEHSHQYLYDGDDLISVVVEQKIVALYRYDDLHNLVRAEHNDHSIESMTYDKDHDRLRSYLGRDGCRDEISYQDADAAKNLHYVSQLEHHCEGQLLHREQIEFWYLEVNAEKVLQRVRLLSAGHQTDVHFDPIWQKPDEIRDESGLRRFRFDQFGRLLQKEFKGELLTYHYNSKNQPISVSSKQHLLNISYDGFGRMAKVRGWMNLNFHYAIGDRIPIEIEQPGLGVIQIGHDQSGHIKAIHGLSLKIKQEVAQQSIEVFEVMDLNSLQLPF